MDFFVQEPGEPRLPPHEVRLRKLQITPLENGNRVKIYLELSPFQKRPNVEATIFTASGKRVAYCNILDASTHKMEFTMHMRPAIPGCDYRFEARVYYQKLPERGAVGVDVPIPEPMVTDRREVTFTLPLQAS